MKQTNNFTRRSVAALAVLITMIISGGAGRAQVAQGGTYTLEQSVIAGGGGTGSSGGTYSLSGSIGQTVAGTTSTASPFTIRAGFFTPETVGATAADVTISGRVRTANGRGIRNIRITMLTADGTTHTVLSSSFGYYAFAGVAAGQIVFLTATGKHFVFSQPTQVLSLTESAGGIDFIASEQ